MHLMRDGVSSMGAYLFFLSGSNNSSCPLSWSANKLETPASLGRVKKQIEKDCQIHHCCRSIKSTGRFIEDTIFM